MLTRDSTITTAIHTAAAHLPVNPHDCLITLAYPGNQSSTLRVWSLDSTLGDVVDNTAGDHATELILLVLAPRVRATAALTSAARLLEMLHSHTRTVRELLWVPAVHGSVIWTDLLSSSWRGGIVSPATQSTAPAPTPSTPRHSSQPAEATREVA